MNTCDTLIFSNTYFSSSFQENAAIPVKMSESRSIDSNRRRIPINLIILCVIFEYLIYFSRFFPGNCSSSCQIFSNIFFSFFSGKFSNSCQKVRITFNWFKSKENSYAKPQPINEIATWSFDQTRYVRHFKVHWML